MNAINYVFANISNAASLGNIFPKTLFNFSYIFISKIIINLPELIFLFKNLETHDRSHGVDSGPSK